MHCLSRNNYSLILLGLPCGALGLRAFMSVRELPLQQVIYPAILAMLMQDHEIMLSSLLQKSIRPNRHVIPHACWNCKPASFCHY